MQDTVCFLFHLKSSTSFLSELSLNPFPRKDRRRKRFELLPSSEVAGSVFSPDCAVSHRRNIWFDHSWPILATDALSGRPLPPNPTLSLSVSQWLHTASDEITRRLATTHVHSHHAPLTTLAEIITGLREGSSENRGLRLSARPSGMMCDLTAISYALRHPVQPSLTSQTSLTNSLLYDLFEFRFCWCWCTSQVSCQAILSPHGSETLPIRNIWDNHWKTIMINCNTSHKDVSVVISIKKKNPKSKAWISLACVRTLSVGSQLDTRTRPSTVLP